VTENEIIYLFKKYDIEIAENEVHIVNNNEVYEIYLKYNLYEIILIISKTNNTSYCYILNNHKYFYSLNQPFSIILYYLYLLFN
jgi:hypothetical protein